MSKFFLICSECGKQRPIKHSEIDKSGWLHFNVYPVERKIYAECPDCVWKVDRFNGAS